MPGICCALKCQLHHQPNVGGGLLPIAVGQHLIGWLIHRYREQAPSHILSFISF
ncbi:hypothetical protein C4J92_4332 [Pseudomonas sp. R3-18-08]|nr:hypothetical protein C4J92_4332 [Pseudomonas sp. R3-18-08]